MIRLFRHYVSKSLLLLGLIEALIFILSVYLSVKLRFLDENLMDEQYLFANLSMPKIAVFAVVMLLTMTAMGLYQRDMRGGLRNMVLRVSISFLVGLATMSAIYYLLPNLLLGRGILALAGVSAFAGVLLGRVIYLRFAKHAFPRKRILVVGAGARAAAIEKLLPGNAVYGLEVVGFLQVGSEAPGVRVDRLLNWSGDLLSIVRRHDIDEIVVAVDDRRNVFPSEDLVTCKMRGIEVMDIVPFLEQNTGKIDVHSMRPSHVIFADGYVQTVVRPFGKRIFDLLVSTAILTVTWPVMLATAAAIWAESGFRGNVFYRQTRVGEHGRHFQILKFRSMVENAERKGAQWAVENDPRITKVGHFIRKTRIDELPQILNVLRGDMSFVGPRPERPEFVSQLEKSIPYYNLRHGLKPGITGWAQVCFPYGASEEDALEKLQYDLYYLKNYSVFLDLTIIFQTVQVVLWQKGSR